MKPLIKLSLEDARKQTNDLNVVISNRKHWRKLVDALFTNENDTEVKLYVSKSLTFEDLLTELGIYKSKAECRRAGRSGPIPKGFTTGKGIKGIKVSKTSYLAIYQPS